MNRYRLLRALATERPDIRFTFATLQGFRVTTVDAYDVDDPAQDEIKDSELWGPFEVSSSSWLAEMDKVVRDHDSDADFMESSHHFVILRL